MSDVQVADPIQKSYKRQRFLLTLLTVLFTLWVIAMLAMYFTTVYPQRHHAAQQVGNPTKSV